MRTGLAAGLLAAALLATGGCADDGGELRTGPVDPGPRPTLSPSAGPTLPPAPLAGLGSPDRIVARRAVAVPLRVGAGSPGPAGLDTADLIYQEYAESGSLHLLAVYQSREAARIGPVTEIRPVDVKTLTVLNALVGYGGGPEGFLTQLESSKLPAVSRSQRADLFPGGYTSTGALYRVVPAGGTPPPTFVYAAQGEPVAGGAKAAQRLTVTAPGRPAQVWTYDEPTSTWRSQLGGVTVAVASVVVLTMPYKTVSVRRPVPRDLPSAQVLGEGPALAVSGPSAATGSWRKGGLRQMCNVVDGSGFPVRLQPGTTWVVYAPTGSTVVVA
ncbi:MAG TPA: DUF3048 domain-containing protein [Micromonosporaceae bacterium]|nr:DUF3048 domain-containing protein [Micromonosporaceae bacterium]